VCESSSQASCFSLAFFRNDILVIVPVSCLFFCGKTSPRLLSLCFLCASLSFLETPIIPIGWKIELELGNKQDLLEIGKQKQIRKPMDFVLSKNDKTDPPHNTRAIIAESLGMSTGKAKLGGDHGNQYKKVPSLSKNDKVATPPHNILGLRSRYTLFLCYC